LTASKISKGIVKDIIIVVVGVLIIWIGLQIIFGTQNPFFVVSSGSMVPELEVYDVLVVQGNTPFEEIEIGDVIVFNKPSGPDRVIVHRVVAVIDENPLTLKTKGDANPASIPGTDFPITEEEYIGQVEYVIPQVGYVTRILSPPINYIVIAIIVGIMIFKQILKSKKEKVFRLDESDSNNDTVEQSTTKWDSLDEIPKDDIYTSSETNEKETKPDEKNQSELKSEDATESDDSESKEIQEKPNLFFQYHLSYFLNQTLTRCRLLDYIRLEFLYFQNLYRHHLLGFHLDYPT